MQVLNNLLTNAVKFTDAGEVLLRVELAEETRDTARLLFSVTDTGIGIAEQDRTRVFHSFSQVDGSITRRFGGTGLGLSISKQLVEMLGGTIGFESDPGKGSRFWFQLTLPKSHILEKPPGTQEGEPFIPAAERALDVLLVEDDRINQVLALQLLEKQGHRVTLAANGQEALERLSAGRFDLVLMDIQMPVMDGIEATARIRSDPRYSELPIIALTAYAVKGDRERFLAQGMDDYISKPIGMKAFYAILKRYIDGTAQTEARQVRGLIARAAGVARLRPKAGRTGS